MEASRFDRLAKALSSGGTRRGLLGLLTTLPLLGGLIAILDPDDADAKGRRKRRKKAHKHGKGRRRKHHKKCNADSKGKTCSGTCGAVLNNCKKTVDCGSCDCPAPCGDCFICQEQGPNTPSTCVVDPEQVGESCGSDGQTCQANGACVCIPVDPCTNGVCGTAMNNCGQPITCAPCPVINTFAANPATIDRGAVPPETADLFWVTSNATTCTLDDGTGPRSVACNLAGETVGRRSTTTYNLFASNATGAQVFAQATVTVKYCHAVVSASGACPSGETEFCLAIPIVATDKDHAQAACEACATDTCGSGPGPSGGLTWSSPGLSAFYFYGAASDPSCGGFIPQAGDITDLGACLEGRWAPEDT